MDYEVSFPPQMTVWAGWGTGTRDPGGAEVGWKKRSAK
jgi:hypothetical protein